MSDAILAASLLLRVIALVWSVIIARRWHNWWLLSLPAVFAVTIVRQTFTPYTQTGTPWRELSELGISVFSILAMYYLDRFFTWIKHASESKEEAEARYATLVESSADGVVVLQDGVVKFINARGMEIIGHTNRADVLNKPLIDFVSHSHRELVAERYRKRLAGEDVPDKYEIDLLHKDGRIIPVEVSASLIQYEGKPATLSLVRDITERRLAESAMIDSETRYRRLFESAKDGILIINADNGLIIDVNPFLQDLLGFAKTEFLGKGLWEIGVFRDIAANKANFEELRRAGYIRYENLPLKASDGRALNVEFVSNLYEVDHTKIIQCNIRDITDRRRADEALKASEERYRNLVENAPVGITLTNLSGKVASINQALLKMHGYNSSEDFQKTSIADRYHNPEDREKWLEQVRIIGRVEEFEVQLKRKDGTLFWASFSAIPSVTESEEQQFINVVQDITQRKQAENILRVQAELLDIGPDCVDLHDFEGNILFVNRAAYLTLGYTKDELLNMNLSQLDDDESKAQTSARIKELFEKSKLTFYVSHRHKNGSWIPFEVHASLVEYEGKTVIMSVGHDITDRKLAEAEMIRLRQAVEASGEAIFLTDREGIITYVNPEFTKMYGYTAEEITGTVTPRVLKSGMLSKEFYEQFWQKLLDKQVVKREMINKTKDGQLITIDASANPILDDSGNIVGFLDIHRDITESKQMQLQLMAQDRLASIGQLVAGVAHEINNPLTSVIGFSDLLMARKDMPADARDDLETVNREAKRTAGIVKGLLTFSRGQKAEKESVDIHGVLESVLKLRAYEQRVNNIEVQTNFAPDLPKVYGNVGQIQQVAINMIINAEQAMLEAHKRGKLTISTEGVGDSVRISLADDGPGISPENMMKLFTPFFTTKEVGKGTGLGLSVCHGIVTEHGGRVFAESEYGKGATFIVELPISR